MAEGAGGTPEPIGRLIDEFHRLPGIGPKSAQRLAYHILRVPERDALALAEAIGDVKRRIIFCSSCLNITESDPCSFCQDQRRDRTIICVVEQPLDILAIERSGSFRGLYHVLHGLLNPMDGVGPEDLHIRELVERVRAGEVTEIIMATNPSLEGEATAMYVQRLLAPAGVRVTRLARGLPSGADLEYADDITLARALEGRQEL
ncbi:MAG: recombination protein RecR [Dehalococcoidia bacterium]|nr:MAG: recombination protein RecR [bacterium]MCE7929377.1 recombination protein RecR [Chloroflexi bacterium CFX7]MCK6564967.1 recombination mediator RecR [Dehalococcoidia bacterium]MCL4232304.1 recombination mediator RecR [Dehalococcoidia bacterium]NUQ56097.1 recombination protein RecR [Dehalococcoidia bacterium]